MEFGKNSRFSHGRVSIFLAAAGLLFAGLIDMGAGIPWYFEHDIAYISIFAIIFFIVRCFMYTERSLNHKLAYSRHTLLTGVAGELLAPLTFILDKMQALQNETDRNAEQSAVKNVREKVL